MPSAGFAPLLAVRVLRARSLARCPRAPCAVLTPSASRRGARAPATTRAARLRLWREISALRRAEARAAGSGKLARAAELRDAARALEREDPWVRVGEELREAVEGEMFLRAARLRDLLRGMERPPVVGVGVGVEVEMEAEMEAWFEGGEGVRWFGVRCRVRNRGAAFVQVVGREWWVEGGDGGGMEVRGVGVGVGRAVPVLAPGEEMAFDSRVAVGGRGERGGSGVGGVVGSVSGVLKVVGGEEGEDAWTVDIGETQLVLPTSERTVGCCSLG